MSSNLAFYLRFAAVGLGLAVAFVVGSLVIGRGVAAAIDGLFFVGVAAAAVAVLFTRPSVFRRRSIQRSVAEDDDEWGDDDGDDLAVDESTLPSLDEGSDPTRQIRIGIGLIVLATVSLFFSAVLHFLVPRFAV